MSRQHFSGDPTLTATNKSQGGTTSRNILSASMSLHCPISCANMIHIARIKSSQPYGLIYVVVVEITNPEANTFSRTSPCLLQAWESIMSTPQINREGSLWMWPCSVGPRNVPKQTSDVRLKHIGREQSETAGLRTPVAVTETFQRSIQWTDRSGR